MLRLHVVFALLGLVAAGLLLTPVYAAPFFWAVHWTAEDLGRRHRAPGGSPISTRRPATRAFRASRLTKSTSTRITRRPWVVSLMPSTMGYSSSSMGRHSTTPTIRAISSRTPARSEEHTSELQ